MRCKVISLTKLVAAILFSCCLLQADWFSFAEEGAARTPQVDVISSSGSNVILDINLFGTETKEIDTKKMTDVGEEVFVLLSIGEYTYTTDIGKPKLPLVTSVLDVPHEATVRVEVLKADYTEIDLATIGIDKRIMPALASVPKVRGAIAEFVIDKKTYSTDAFYPDRIFDIEEYEGFARGHRIATLKFFPIHYNPVTNKIKFYSNIQVKVNFINGDIAETKRIISENYSTIWENFIEMMVVNYPDYLRGVSPLPIYYEIYYNNAFSEAAESLAFWKKKKGYKVRMWDATGWSASAIDDTIESQTPQATFLVVIGDPNSSTPLPASGSGTSSGDQTDLYYAETDDTGYLPDLYNARISVLDATQANTVIQKALRYEHANFGTAGTDWLKRACFIAGYDPYGNQPIGMATNWYCRNLLVPHGYTVDTLVYASGEQEGRVVAQVNAGRAWCVYTAHGGQTEWSVGYSSDFNVSELSNLTNNLDMYPMACGHCCLAADYQYSQNCFGETWDRLSGKGGICYFGSVPSTYWDEDDWLQRRYFDAIYADSIPGNLYETGRFTQWALYWINNNTATSRKQYYFEAYHIFNDPSLDFWTDIPDSMIVTHDDVVFPGSSSFSVTVHDGGAPLEDALVCCWVFDQSPEMHVSDYTNGSGVATLSITPTTPGDTMFITVTKHNYVPYEGYALITVPSGPYLTQGSLIVDDAGGNGQANPDEVVDLGIWVKNIGADVANSVYGLLSASDPYAFLEIDSSWYGDIPESDSSLSNPYYRCTIADSCPNNHTVSLTLELHDSSDSTWISHPSLTVYAPVLTFRDVSVMNDDNGNGVLDPGETADLVVTIANEGGAVAENVTSILSTGSPYITLNDNSGDFGTIDPDTTSNNSSNPYNVTADSLTPTGTLVQLEIEVVSGVYLDTLSFNVIVGKKHYYLWNPDPTPTPGLEMDSILLALGYSGDYGTTLAPDLSLYHAVLVCVGIYSSNYRITSGSPEAAALVDYLENQGGHVYLEGGDVWYWDPVYSGGYDFCPLFGINAVADGTSDLSPVVGESGAFTDGMNFTYSGENNYIDHIDPAGGFLIFHDGDNSYNCGIANDPGTYRTVGTSFELGLLNDATVPSTRAALLDSIMRYFNAGSPGDLVPPAASNITHVEKSGNDVILTWDKVVTDALGNPETMDYYIVYRNTAPDFVPGSSDSIGSVNNTDTTYTDIGALSSGENYHYLVVAVDVAGNRSQKSNMAYVFRKTVDENTATKDKDKTMP